ncbi:helicase-associated domain-containing protein [Corynebacterium frankenforstense]
MNPSESSPTSATPAERFGDWLAGLDDAALTRLLELRPDAAVPPPPNTQALATRLRITGSVARAVAERTALELAVCESAAALGAATAPVAAVDVLAPLPDAAPAARALDSVRSAGLMWGPDDGVRLLPEVPAALPDGLSLLEEAHSPADPQAVHEALESLPDSARAVLDTLARTGGVGLTRDAAPDADPERPVPRLLAAGLLSRVDARTVRMPRVVRDALRERPHTAVPLTDPLAGLRAADAATDAEATGPDAAADADDRADREATGQGLEAVRLMDRLIEVLGAEPGELIRSGGLAVRELRRLCAALDCEPDALIRLAGTGVSAGLLACARPDRDDDAADPAEPAAPVFAPTPLAEEWAEEGLAARWARLVTGWRGATLAPWTVTGSVHLFEEASHAPGQPAARRLVLAPYAEVADNTALSPQTAWAAAVFDAPLAALRVPDAARDEVLAGARFFGLLARAGDDDRAAGLGRVALTGADAGELTEAAAALVPDTVEAVIVQADMTVLAPGPLPARLANRLARFADLESPGLAAVYRLSAESIRRALDAGDSAEDIAAFFTDHALGEVPQGVRVLVEDVARSHGHLRGGPAGCYLRCDDPDQLAAAAGTDAARAVGLRLIAPTVAVSPRPLIEVIGALQATGVHAVAEDAAGRSVDIRPDPVRVTPPRKRRTRRRSPTPAATGVDRAERARAAVAALRRAEGTATASTPLDDAARADAARSGAAGAAGAHGAGGADGVGRDVGNRVDPVAALKTAARAGRTVTVGLVDKHGRANPRRLRPLRVEGGQVYAVEPAAGDAVLRFALHRVTGVDDA